MLQQTNGVTSARHLKWRLGIKCVNAARVSVNKTAGACGVNQRTIGVAPWRHRKRGRKTSTNKYQRKARRKRK